MKKGFTLLELIIVVIILGILVSIAIPRFIGTRAKARAAEALNTLGSLRAAQIRYAEDHAGTYFGGVGGTACGTNIDVQMTNLNYHNAAVCYDGSVDSIVSIQNNQGDNYTLCIDANGGIACTGTGCTGIGYTATACP